MGIIEVAAETWEKTLVVLPKEIDEDIAEKIAGFLEAVHQPEASAWSQVVEEYLKRLYS